MPAAALPPPHPAGPGFRGRASRRAARSDTPRTRPVRARSEGRCRPSRSSFRSAFESRRRSRPNSSRSESNWLLRHCRYASVSGAPAGRIAPQACSMSASSIAVGSAGSAVPAWRPASRAVVAVHVTTHAINQTAGHLEGIIARDGRIGRRVESSVSSEEQLDRQLHDARIERAGNRAERRRARPPHWARRGSPC